MKRIYVAGPFTAPTRAEIERNVDAAIAAGEMIDAAGGNACVPHLFIRWDDRHPGDYERWMKKCFAELDRSDALYLLRKSPGASREEQRATARKMPIFYLLHDAIKYARGEVL